jgi:hypothetical protein
MHHGLTSITPDPKVEAQLDQLANASVAELRTHYRALFGREPPQAFGPDLLRRSLSYRIQEKAYGGLSRATQRLLDQLVKAYAAKPKSQVELPRRIKPGSILVREWKGKSYRVTVLTEGFSYGGETYTHLSEIAGLITGTRWNGPRFFGLRAKAQSPDATTKAAKTKINKSRPSKTTSRLPPQVKIAKPSKTARLSRASTSAERHHGK